MRRTVLALIASGAFALAACSQDTTNGAPDQSAPIRSVGTVQALDAAAGTITLEHEPIPAIKWGAMTMEFKAEKPGALDGLQVGDRVSFELKSAADPQTVTTVQKQ